VIIFSPVSNFHADDGNFDGGGTNFVDLEGIGVEPEIHHHMHVSATTIVQLCWLPPACAVGQFSLTCQLQGFQIQIFARNDTSFSCVYACIDTQVVYTCMHACMPQNTNTSMKIDKNATVFW
jgi:hypothetical protein